MIEVKTQVQVMADILSGRSVSETARRNSVSRPTVRQIRAKWREGGGAVGECLERNRLEIDTLIYDALVASFEAQEKIMEAVGSEEYILKQRGRDNAKLLDVIGNFTLELLYIYYGLERRKPSRTR